MNIALNLLDGFHGTIAAALAAASVAGGGADLATHNTSGTVPSHSLWMPTRASSIAAGTDWLFYFILIICVFFTVLVAAVMVYFAWKYRHVEGMPAPGKTAGHSTALEITWTVIPTLIVILIFFYGFRGYLDQVVVPPDAINVKVIGQMWKWNFEYAAAKGGGSDVLYLPLNKPVEFTLQSQDVIHSLFIPAFRLKKDVVPGRYNKMWVTPIELGEFPIECAEYCGTNHSQMAAKCVVLSEDDWLKKMDELSDVFRGRTSVEVGKLLYTQKGCSGCHSLDGSVIIGPSWKNVWGHEAEFTDGTKQIADENYVRESILYPQKEIVAGFGGQMPSYAGSLNDKEIDAIIEFMKTLADGYKPVAGVSKATGAGEVMESKGEAVKNGKATGSTSIGGPRSEGNPQGK